MKFVILGFDGPDGEAKRKIYRPAHLAKMEPLDAQGRVVLAGPLTDKTGSLIVIEADSLEDAQRFAREDPYTVHGVFERVEVHPFIQVFPKATVAEGLTLHSLSPYSVFPIQVALPPRSSRGIVIRMGLYRRLFYSSLSSSLFVLFLWGTPAFSAATKTVIADGQYVMADGDTLAGAEEKVLQRAQRKRSGRGRCLSRSYISRCGKRIRREKHANQFAGNQNDCRRCHGNGNP